MTTISENMVDIVTTMYGMPVEEGNIVGKQVSGHNNFQDYDAFLEANGNRTETIGRGF